MLVLALKDGDVLDLGGKVRIRVRFDRRRTNLMRLSIDGDIAPIRKIDSSDADASEGRSDGLVERGQPVYKPKY
jgi:hypothetical protein